jgi:predicted extracellular nuclease
MIVGMTTWAANSLLRHSSSGTSIMPIRAAAVRRLLLIGAVTVSFGSAQAQTVINEIRIDQPGDDNDEYFELSGDPDANLTGLTYLVIGDATAGSGVIESVTDLDGESLGDLGLFVAAESTFGLGTADLTTNLNFENSDNVTHLLVQGFSGANGDDLDIDDNGVLDATPWTAVLDAVGLVETPGSGDAFYGAALGFQDVGPDGTFVPGYVCRDDSAFVIGAFDPAGGNDTPGAVNECQGGVGAEPLATFIHEVQGTGAAVAITELVTVTAIVTSLFEDNDQVEGFFNQEEDVDVDADPATSEGIFVFCDTTCPALAAGQRVTVTGLPEEFFGMSQIDTTGAAGDIEVHDSAPEAVSATAVSLPAAGSTRDAATFEALEGMLVTFPDQLVVSEYFELARFGQVVLTLDSRPVQFTQVNLPSAAGFEEFEDALARRRIILDDVDNDQNDAIVNGSNPDEAYFYPEGGFSTDNFFRGGDSITGLTGVLHWSFAGFSGTDAWRVRPVASGIYAFAPDNFRDAAPANVGGDIKVASFNVLNYFTTVDVTASNNVGDCGPSGTLDCRGADSAEELARQTAKIVAALRKIDADIVSLIEIENDAGAATDALVAALNDTPGEDYAFIDTGPIGTDAIKVALIYKPGAVKPYREFAILDSSVDPRFLDTLNRPMLAQTFKLRKDASKRFTVVAGHLKSKGSACDGVGDPDLGDGQGNCNATRTAATQALTDWLASDPTKSGDPDFVIIGDMNAYAKEDPVTSLEAAGYVNLVDAHEGSNAYSFVFDGRIGYLDHALANGSMASQVTGVTTWHINSDEIPVLDYNDDVEDPGEASFERESAALPLFDQDAFRSSDHDPVIVGLDLDGAGNM